MAVTVVIATFGAEEWKDLAHHRAAPSARAQGHEPILSHADTLHEARNQGLAQVQTEQVCFLDADDELEPGYFDAMAKGTADLRAPSVRYIGNGSDRRARMPRVAGHRHDCIADCLAFGNWLVIGTIAPTWLLTELGGFRDWPIYEDYDLWARCWQMGATVEAIPSAVYRAHARRDSRNRGQGRHIGVATHRAIAQDLGLPVP